MMFYKTGFKAWKDPYSWGDSINIVYYEARDGKTFVQKVVELCEVKQGEEFFDSHRISSEAAQDLMDALWDCGLRPKQGAGSAGQLAAVENHLQDMRKLVFETPQKG